MLENWHFPFKNDFYVFLFFFIFCRNVQKIKQNYFLKMMFYKVDHTKIYSLFH